MRALMFDVITLDDAVSRIDERINKLHFDTETVPLAAAIGRICAEDVFSYEDIPHFFRSTVDGYAVKASETYGASESVPAMFRIIGEGRMGEAPAVSIGSGEAFRIPTGGMMPEGADCAVMVEYTDESGDELYIMRPARVRENTVDRGEDVTCGTVIAPRGTKMTALKCGVLAAAGVTDIRVYKKLSLGIISTGDELISPECEPKDAMIRDVNTALVQGLLMPVCDAVYKKILPDDIDAIRDALQHSIENCDITVISGGSSVGERDYTYRLLCELCDEVYIKGIGIKPGKPTMAGTKGDKLVFGLAGHVMAAAVTCKLLILSPLQRAMGAADHISSVKAKAACNFPSASGRSTVIPVQLTESREGYTASPLFSKSGLISLIARADGFTVIQAKTEGVYKDEILEVTLL